MYNSCVKHGYEDNHCINNIRESRHIRDWSRACDHLIFWHYPKTLYDYLLPPPGLTAMGEQLRFFARHNGRGVFFQGAGRDGPFEDVWLYVLCRLAWNAQLDASNLAEEFSRLYYGQAADTMLRILRTLSWDTGQHDSHPQFNGQMDSYGHTEAQGRKLKKLFEQALQEAESDEIRSRIERDSICAYAISLGPHVRYGRKPPHQPTADQKSDYRKLAHELATLQKKHDVRARRESNGGELIQKKVEQALGVEEE